MPVTRTVALRIEGASAEAGPYLIHNEPVWKDGSLIGHVTSGGWGWRAEGMLGLASLHRSGGVTKTWLEEGGGQVYSNPCSTRPSGTGRGDFSVTR